MKVRENVVSQQVQHIYVKSGNYTKVKQTNRINVEYIMDKIINYIFLDSIASRT